MPHAPATRARPGLDPCPTQAPPVPLAARIRALRLELAALEAQQRHELLFTVVLTVGSGVVFSARELWDRQVLSRALRDAFTESGIRSARQLGKRLQQLAGTPHTSGAGCLTRVGVEHNRALWVVTAE
jgi:hypothetical protein